ncbi:MAG: MBL fold metallo-hydrolase [Marinobacter sp.]|uniref:MBL fold metallo-hydrolase n=1 Tax=Marinobacter sp. TaxID=50741 RepID=UPI00299E28B4|nr:MBL fold metallo-hydrolase [Marinobacter sp.]MDX1757843.1 MBL fold metallo-hydrolase [Marinobacter sp.]
MEIRPAATLALIRPAPAGLEVLLLQRTWDAAFLPGHYVFPGGAVDASDQAAQAHMAGTDDQTVSQAMSLEGGGINYLIAAVRECFEEAGLLLAHQASGEPLNAPQLAAVQADREAVFRGELSFEALCRNHHLALPLDRLAYLSHWITPAGAPRRFDTRFFVALSPPHQPASHDGVETIDHVWLPPQQALADHRSGQRLIGVPTLRTLRFLSEFDSPEAVLAYAHANPPPARATRPWPARKGDRPTTVEAGTPAYSEVAKLDPQRRGHASAVITPGRPVSLGQGVIRLTANNGGLMTGPGTNCYLLGQPGAYTVIDPGPAQDEHLTQLLALTDGQIRQVLVTHTHRDHSPAASVLKQRTGARLIGLPAPAGAAQDRDFVPDHQPLDGERIDTAAGPLKVLHTPGHASNHLCYLLAGEQMLFSGDHIMQGSTVVINPPDGNMKAYLASLARLLTEEIHYIAPGHGFLMAEPQVVVDVLTTHRLAREHKVIQALRQHAPASLETLTPVAYDDVPAAIHGLAARSLLAHLEKLREEGRARYDDQHGVWTGGQS